jgi:hypothetical protein
MKSTPRENTIVAESAMPLSMPSDARVELLREVLSSRTFAKSVRLARFLEFICLRAIEGKARELNEQQIGIHVFDRSPAYSASDDSIVRTQARLLRQRLEEYFEHECPDSSQIISIPKGGYVPIFEPRFRQRQAHPIDLPASANELQVIRPAAEHETVTPPARPRASKRLIFSVAALVAVCLLGAITTWFWSHNRDASASGALWSSIFSHGRSVVIVPSDDALVLFQELTQTPVPLDEYISGSYLEKAKLPQAGSAVLTSDWFANHQYTSTADLNLALRLGRLPQAANAGVESRNARVVRIDDLKSRNVILIGGVGANPWVSLFANHLNFDVKYDWKSSQGYVVNKHPQSGEIPIYRDLTSDGSHRSYGVLALLPGIEDDGVVLLFQGTGMAGTESAADFPFNPGSFRSFARQIGATPDHMPYFEALLETISVGGNAPEARLVAYRVIKP